MNTESKKAVNSIGRSIANINKQLEILSKEYPEAMMYVEDGTNYHVMKGDPHDTYCAGNTRARQDRILASFNVHRTECGAW